MSIKAVAIPMEPEDSEPEVVSGEEKDESDSIGDPLEPAGAADDQNSGDVADSEVPKNVPKKSGTGIGIPDLGIDDALLGAGLVVIFIFGNTLYGLILFAIGVGIKVYSGELDLDFLEDIFDYFS